MSLRPLETSGRLNKRELISALAEELKKTKEKVTILQEKVDQVEAKLDLQYEKQESLQHSYASRRTANENTIASLRREISAARAELEEAAILDEEDAAQYLDLLSPGSPTAVRTPTKEKEKVMPEVRVVGATPTTPSNAGGKKMMNGSGDEEEVTTVRPSKPASTVVAPPPPPPPKPYIVPSPPNRTQTDSPPPIKINSISTHQSPIPIVNPSSSSSAITAKQKLDRRLKILDEKVDLEISKRVERRLGSPPSSPTGVGTGEKGIEEVVRREVEGRKAAEKEKEKEEGESGGFRGLVRALSGGKKRFSLSGNNGKHGRKISEP